MTEHPTSLQPAPACNQPARPDSGLSLLKDRPVQGGRETTSTAGWLRPRRRWSDTPLPHDLDDWDGCCPVCGEPSIYVRVLDRFLHVDGSDNRPCWRVILRGGAS